MTLVHHQSSLGGTASAHGRILRYRRVLYLIELEKQRLIAELSAKEKTERVPEQNEETVIEEAELTA